MHHRPNSDEPTVAGPGPAADEAPAAEKRARRRAATGS